MTGKLTRPEEIISKLREADILIEQGHKLAHAIKSIGITEVTFYRWRQEFGGISTSQARRLKGLEQQNLRLQKADSDLTLDKRILQEAAKGNF